MTGIYPLGHRVRSKGAEMAGGFVLAAIVVFAAFTAGAVIGMIIAVAVAVRREDKRLSLRGIAPDWLSGGARLVNGVASW